MSHIFISYSHKDLDFAQKIVTALADNKLDTWIDWKSIPKGEDWEQEIYHGIEEADAFLFLISPDSVKSEMCNKEIAHAVRNGKRILPIVIRDANVNEFIDEITKKEILKRNWIFCRYRKEPPDIIVLIDDFENAICEIHKTIHTDYEWLKYHTELQVKALKWENKKDISRLLRGKELQEAENQFAVSYMDPQPTEIQRKYLLNSRRNEERQRRQIMLGLSLGLIIVAFLAVFSWQQRNQAVSETNAKATALVNEETARNTAIAETNIRATAQSQAETQRDLAISGKLAIESNTLIENNLELAMLLAAQSYTITPSVDAERSLLESILQSPRLLKFLPVNSTTAFSFSQDGRLLAIADDDRNISIWSLDNNPLSLKFILPQGEQIISLSFGNTSNSLVFGCADGDVYFWDLGSVSSSPRIMFREIGEIDQVMLLSPNQIAVKLTDGKLKIWNIILRNLEATYDLPGGVGTSIIQANGKVFSLERDLTSSRYSVLDALAGDMVNSQIDITYIHGATLAASSDGKLLATGDCDPGSYTLPCFAGRIVLWDILNSKMAYQWGWHDDWVSGLSISSDNKLIASASGGEFNRKPGVIQLWSVRDTGTITQVLDLGLPMYGHTARINELSFSPDNRYLVSGGQQVLFWDTDRDRYYIPEVHIQDIQQNQDFSKLLLSGYSPYKGVTKIRLVDVYGNKLSELIKVSCSPVENCEKAIFLNDEKLNDIPTDPSQSMVSLGFGREGQAWIALDTSFLVMILDLSSPSNQFKITPDFTGNLILIPGTDILLIDDYESTKLELWDLSIGKKIRTLDLGGEFQDGFSIVPDPAGRLFMAHDDNTILVLDAKSGNRMGRIDLPDYYVAKSISFATEGRIFAVELQDQGGIPSTVMLWNLDDYSLLGSFAGQLKPTLSSQGDVLVTVEDGPWDTRIVLWDVGTQSKINDFTAGDREVIGDVLLDLEQGFLFGRSREKIIVWDIDSPSPIGVIQSDGWIYNMRYGNQYLAYGGCSHTTYRIMEDCYLGEFETLKIEPTFWHEKICKTVSRNLTKSEWYKYIGVDIPYKPTCSNLPAPAE